MSVDVYFTFSKLGREYHVAAVNPYGRPLAYARTCGELHHCLAPVVDSLHEDAPNQALWMMQDCGESVAYHLHPGEGVTGEEIRAALRRVDLDDRSRDLDYWLERVSDLPPAQSDRFYRVGNERGLWRELLELRELLQAKIDVLPRPVPGEHFVLITGVGSSGVEEARSLQRSWPGVGLILLPEPRRLEMLSPDGQHDVVERVRQLVAGPPSREMPQEEKEKVALRKIVELAAWARLDVLQTRKRPRLRNLPDSVAFRDGKGGRSRYPRP